ncbi:hybrid signal transduction histidine kinase A-like isoform X2 [Harpegnathos saltator]|uniref:hybrid signal transduction histidine kinase A-like isoform X2 n=1 Tax=Harpegnathos saltator TaxID=610380 RepID=UPI000DBEDD83|nr:hybrid signal transduction histidine kinase A-like isoform X2 [Harpegnathos saltator]
MVRVCSANNCSNKYSTGIKFRRCPCIPHLQQQWLEKLNRSTMGNEFYLCEEHFSREDLQTNTRSLIPIIFCNCSNTCRNVKPLQVNNKTFNPLEDHPGLPKHLQNRNKKTSNKENEKLCIKRGRPKTECIHETQCPIALRRQIVSSLVPRPTAIESNSQRNVSSSYMHCNNQSSHNVTHCDTNMNVDLSECKIPSSIVQYDNQSSHNIGVTSCDTNMNRDLDECQVPSSIMHCDNQSSHKIGVTYCSANMNVILREYKVPLIASKMNEVQTTTDFNQSINNNNQSTNNNTGLSAIAELRDFSQSNNIHTLTNSIYENVEQCGKSKSNVNSKSSIVISTTRYSRNSECESINNNIIVRNMTGPDSYIIFDNTIPDNTILDNSIIEGSPSPNPSIVNSCMTYNTSTVECKNYFIQNCRKPMLKQSKILSIDIQPTLNPSLKLDSILQQNRVLKRKIDSLRKLATYWQKKLSSFKNKLSSRFGEDQLNALCLSSSRGSKWTNKTLQIALQLHFASGTTGYQLQSQLQMPLPSVRLLQSKLQHVQFSPDGNSEEN